MRFAKRFTSAFRFLVLGLMLALLPLEVSAGYKVVLKDGRVLDARTKPISMEGYYRFTDNEGRFQSIPLQLVDLSATNALSTKEPPKSAPGRVLTNEDLATGKQTEGSRLNTIGPNSKPGAKGASPALASKRGEAYWRSRAKQIRDEIDSVEKQIKALNEKTQQGKGDGIKIGFETYNSVIYADFESQVKELEKRREKLQKAMAQLEEEARKDGALPGWLR
jgi:hypothetical protein